MNFNPKPVCRFGIIAGLAFILSNIPLAAQPSQPEEGFVSLFDGKSLEGWKIGANAAVFQVHDGMIVMECPADDHDPAHLFYDGEVGGHKFKNFDLRVDVMTYPKANSGIYFHTQFQESGWPKMGIECQVDNSHSDWRRTGSLYGIVNLTWGPEVPGANNKQKTIVVEPQPVKDNSWYTQEIICKDGAITVKLNSQTMIDYTVADADTQHRLSTGMTWLPAGTICLQGHPPMPGAISKACFKNIRIKVLPD